MGEVPVCGGVAHRSGGGPGEWWARSPYVVVWLIASVTRGAVA